MEGRRPEETEKERLWETEEKERETGGGGKKYGRDGKRDIDTKLEKEARKRQKRKTEKAEKSEAGRNE